MSARWYPAAPKVLTLIMRVRVPSSLSTLIYISTRFQAPQSWAVPCLPSTQQALQIYAKRGDFIRTKFVKRVNKAMKQKQNFDMKFKMTLSLPQGYWFRNRRQWLRERENGLGWLTENSNKLPLCENQKSWCWSHQIPFLFFFHFQDFRGTICFLITAMSCDRIK